MHAQVQGGEESEGKREVWIVFVDEGLSLHDLLYTDDLKADASAEPDNTSSDTTDFHTTDGFTGTPADQGHPTRRRDLVGSDHNVGSRQPDQEEAAEQQKQQGEAQSGEVSSDGLSVVTPSRLWSAIKADSVQGDGDAMREILRQALLALAELHAEGVTHRDVKPENLIVGLQRAHDASDGVRAPRIKLADFGSANTEGIPTELWPPPFRRPSRAEETEDYSPPEVCRCSLSRIVCK